MSFHMFIIVLNRKAAVCWAAQLMLTRLQMGVHEEELVWLEERVRTIKDASGCGNNTYFAEAEATTCVPHGDTTGNSNDRLYANTADS